MSTRRFRPVLFPLALALAGSLFSLPPASAEETLRIAMTATDIPTTTGMPNNGLEGMRFLGYPIFEGLVLWDLTHADRLATVRAGLGGKWGEGAEATDNSVFAP